MPRYKCRICGESFKMESQEASKRSMTPLKRVCVDNKECRVQAYFLAYNKKKENDWKERKKVLKDESWTRTKWKDELQKEINWIVRHIDKDLPCIARPGEATLRFDAGHYYSVAACGSLRFNLHNIHKQSSNSNQFKSGDYLEYRRGLINRYGLEYVLKVEGYKLKYKDIDLSFTIDNLKVWRERAKDVKKQLKSGVQMDRDLINQKIAIYEI